MREFHKKSLSCSTLFKSRGSRNKGGYEFPLTPLINVCYFQGKDIENETDLKKIFFKRGNINIFKSEIYCHSCLFHVYWAAADL